MDKESINHYYRERKTNGNYKQNKSETSTFGVDFSRLLKELGVRGVITPPT